MFIISAWRAVVTAGVVASVFALVPAAAHADDLDGDHDPILGKAVLPTRVDLPDSP